MKWRPQRQHLEVKFRPRRPWLSGVGSGPVALRRPTRHNARAHNIVRDAEHAGYRLISAGGAALGAEMRHIAKIERGTGPRHWEAANKKQSNNKPEDDARGEGGHQRGHATVAEHVGVCFATVWQRKMKRQKI